MRPRRNVLQHQRHFRLPFSCNFNKFMGHVGIQFVQHLDLCWTINQWHHRQLPIIECSGTDWIYSMPDTERRASSSIVPQPMNAPIFTYHRAGNWSSFSGTYLQGAVIICCFCECFRLQLHTKVWRSFFSSSEQIPFNWHNNSIKLFVGILRVPCKYTHTYLSPKENFTMHLRVNTIREEMKVSIGSNSTVCPSIYLFEFPRSPFLYSTSSTLVHLCSYQLPGSIVGSCVHDLLSMT